MNDNAGILTNGYHEESPEREINLQQQNVRIQYNEPQNQQVQNREISANAPLPRNNPLNNVPSSNQRFRKSRETSRISGTVKWFNAKNGFGFITRHDNGEDIFVHCSSIQKKNPRHLMKSLGDGEKVDFNIMAVSVTGPGGSPVKGNPYVSYIPVRRFDVFAGGDPGMMLPIRRYARPPIDFGSSRIPRWTTLYRNPNY